MDLKTPPPSSPKPTSDITPAPAQPLANSTPRTPMATTVQAAHQPAPPKPSKVAAPGVTAAIVATVIIVLGLSALAVIAYIKTRG